MSCKTINIDLANVPPVPLQIGVAGENAFRTITFDASKWGAGYPDATYTVVYRRSDGYLYPVLVNASADAIVWNPTATDTAVSGNGQLEVRLLDGETIGKTIIMQTYVAPSLSGDESEPSTPEPDWVNDVADDADRAEAAVTHYPQIRNGYWWVWDVESGEWVNTGVKATGDGGSDSIVYVTEVDPLHVSMSASEILSAVQNGKFPILKIADMVLPYFSQTGDGRAIFAASASGDNSLGAITFFVDSERKTRFSIVNAPTKTSELENDIGFVNASEAAAASIFIAARGTTTEEEIRAAHSAGKVVICVYQNRVYYLSDISDNASEIVFRTTPNQLGNTYALAVNGSRWIGVTTNLARKSDIPTVPITGVSVNGTALTPQDGVVDVQVPTDYVNTDDFEDRTGSMRIVLSYSNGVVAIEQSGTPLDRLIPAFLNSCNVWFLLPTAYITGIPSNTDMMRFWVAGANLNKSAPTISLTSVYNGKVYHAVLSPVSEYRMEGQLNVYNIALPSAESNSFGGA